MACSVRLNNRGVAVVFGGKKQKSAVIHTLVGDGTRIEGDLHFEGGCHIDGVVHGSVVAERDAEAYLSISEDGRVEGSVEVPRVALNGTVKGDVYAADRVELGPTARVTGNLHYQLLEMAAGAEINGQLIHIAAKSGKSQAAAPEYEATQPIASEAIAKPQT